MVTVCKQHFQLLTELHYISSVLVWISLKFVSRGPIGKKTWLVQVMAWFQKGEKPLPELMSSESHYSCQCIAIINSLWPSDAIWYQRSGSTLAKVMACCLMAPSHCPNQYWLLITEVLWHSSEGNSTGNSQNFYPWYEFQITNLRLQLHFPWTNELHKLYSMEEMQWLDREVGHPLNSMLSAGSSSKSNDLYGITITCHSLFPTSMYS